MGLERLAVLEGALSQVAAAGHEAQAQLAIDMQRGNEPPIGSTSSVKHHISVNDGPRILSCMCEHLWTLMPQPPA